MLDFITNGLNYIMSMLPRSPVRQYLAGVIIDNQYLHVLNWFVPVATIVSILEAWLIAVIAYYLISAVLRFLNIIG